MKHQGWSFTGGCMPQTAFGWFARERDDIAEKGQVVTSFYFHDSAQREPWKICTEIVAWRVKGLATYKPRGGSRLVVALGRQGEYWELEPATASEAVGKVKSASVTALSVIDGAFFSVGMGRSVRRRESRGKWTEVGPGIEKKERGQVIGFTGVAGLTADDLYAVGWGGEIWRGKANDWHRLASVTRGNFNSVACAADGTIYAVGDDGLLARGKGDAFEVLDSGCRAALQAVGVFEREIFAATDDAILKLTPAGLRSEERFRDTDRPKSVLWLLSCEDGLASLGPKDLFLFDGGDYRRLI